MQDGLPTRDWITTIEELRREGVIDDDGEATLVRHLSDRRLELEATMAGLVPEYHERVANDGRQRAGEWLAGQAHELGEADAQATRALLESLRLPLA